LQETKQEEPDQQTRLETHEQQNQDKREKEPELERESEEEEIQNDIQYQELAEVESEQKPDHGSNNKRRKIESTNDEWVLLGAQLAEAQRLYQRCEQSNPMTIIAELRRENEALKAQLVQMQTRLDATPKASDLVEFMREQARQWGEVFANRPDRSV
jgi:hypothetical protein